MEKLRDEDYKIVDNTLKKSQASFGGVSSDVMKDVIKAEEKYYLEKLDIRRHNIRAGREPMEGILVDSKVKNLFELGEITYKEAIRLDYFAMLDTRTRSGYLEVVNGVFDETLERYTMVNNQMALSIAEFRSVSVLAKSAINNARILCLEQSEIRKLSKKRVENMRKENYEKNLMVYGNFIISMSHIAYGNDYAERIGLDDLNEMRKSTATEIAAIAKMLDRYELFEAESGSLFCYGAISVLRGCSLPRDLIKEVEGSQNKVDDFLREGLREQHRSVGKSNLVVIDDKANAQER